MGSFVVDVFLNGIYLGMIKADGFANDAKNATWYKSRAAATRAAGRHAAKYPGFKFTYVSHG